MWEWVTSIGSIYHPILHASATVVTRGCNELLSNVDLINQSNELNLYQAEKCYTEFVLASKLCISLSKSTNNYLCDNSGCTDNTKNPNILIR